MMRKMKIVAKEVVGTGAVDDLGTLGEVVYAMPEMPLPVNYQKIEIKRKKGKLVYIVHFDDGTLPEDDNDDTLLHKV